MFIVRSTVSDDLSTGFLSPRFDSSTGDRFKPGYTGVKQVVK